MNHEKEIQNDFAADQEMMLALLADDELSLPEREALLADLSARPDGWQRVAQALLDAQALTRTLRPAQPTRRVCSEPGSTANRRWSQVAVLAATVLIAFTIGFAWPREMQLVGEPQPIKPSPHVTDSPSEAVVASSPPQQAGLDPELLLSLASFGEDDHALRLEFRKSQEGAVIRYTTHQELPPFMLQAIVAAGHQVNRVQYDVNLSELMADAQVELESDVVSVYETQITPGFLRQL